MAGVPEIFRAMVAGLLPRLTGGRPLLSETLRADLPEGLLAGAAAAGRRGASRRSRSAAIRSAAAAGSAPTWCCAARTPRALAAATAPLRAHARRAGAAGALSAASARLHRPALRRDTAGSAARRCSADAIPVRSRAGRRSPRWPVSISSTR